jgi:hypothetical protein
MTFLFLSGISFLLSQSSAMIVIQTSVDDAHRGRVMALWTLAYLGVRPFASLIDGTAATLVGLRFAALLMTVPTLIGAALVFRLATRVPGPAIQDGSGLPPDPEQLLTDIERRP